ncbi:MAG: SCP2 sterol-binding domain-containing protein [Proteobacteria bacterium]|nr:SCP2 sterol-binding domain-containing protein [Pseudomonadota bacterium]
MIAPMENKIPVWINQIEKLINKALGLDEETLYALAQLQGKVIAFEFINTKLNVFLFPAENGLTIHTAYEEKPDVLIKGTPTNFIMMITSSKQGATGIPTDMQVIGDISLGQRFQDIMQNIEIDLEEPLSRWVGDSMAYQVGKFVRGTGRFAANTSKTLAMDLSEYLRFEIEMLPDDLLVDDFSKEVDLLREDVDRFAQRVNKLEARINNKEQGK